jgi:hypothetical protein
MESDADSLTGVWNGLYTYADQGQQGPFTATLFQSGDALLGTVHEPHPEGQGTLIANLWGARDGSEVRFNKIYDGTLGWRHSINYQGTLNADGSEIEGRWTISAAWSGRFLMVRAPRKSVAAEEKAAERA